MSNTAIVDFVSRMRIGIKTSAKSVYIPYSPIIARLIVLLRDQGCFRGVVIDKYHLSRKMRIKVSLIYLTTIPLIKKVDLISRPGLRIY